ncbi:MAG: paraquat-inducible protein A, partial [Steroidobacteraceae bacterium]
MTIACPDCGTLQQLPRLSRGDIAVCQRCAGRLERVNARSITAALACALTTLLLLFPANLLTLLSVRVFGISVQTQLGSGVFALADKGWILLAVLIGLSAMVLPFVRYGLLVLALGGVQLGYRPPWLGRVFRWAILLDRWTMPEVFLIACAVGYARIAAQASIIHVGAGGYC